MLIKTKAMTIALAALTTACGQSPKSPLGASTTKEAWNAINDPANLQDQYQVSFERLPLKAELDVKPWTDTYWPSYRGGLANRWNDPSHPNSFTYRLADEAAIRSLSEERLARLSPAEKYDIFMGSFDYPLVSEERERTNANDPGWFGLCHGWAPAALNFREPQPVVVASAAGLRVPFGSSDVKALLLFAQQYGRDARTVGDRCNANLSNDPLASNDDPCRDINAGSFHIVLANQIGLLQRGFVAEVNRDYEVWNQPVFGFDSQVIGESSEIYPGAAPGTAKVVKMRTRMRFISEIGPRWDALPFATHPEQEGSHTYEYQLEVNSSGQIIGGEWTGWDRPDFFWTQSAPELTGYFEGLKAIYAAATGT